uniref:Uncharacterized protein n=1 Tax=Globodera rostochiensis TaxID=31243 RepID=A0A914H805_GLORO
MAPSFVWEQKSALELLNGFQQTAECKGKSFCLCEGPYYAQNRGRFGANVPHRLIGTCCDNSSKCQCCLKNNTIVQLPAELSKINETKQCKAMVEEAECNCASNSPNYPKTASAHSCVPDNAWPESACCAEGAHFECCAYPGMDVQLQAAKVLCDANDTKSDDCTAIGYYAKAGFDCEHPPEINSLCFFNFAIARHSVRASWPSTLPTLPNKTDENGKCNNAEEIKRICGCDSYKCIRNAGFASSACCAENFEFTCCHLGQVSTTTVSTTITASTVKSPTTTTFKTTEETEPTTVSEVTANTTGTPLSCLLEKACALNKHGSAKLGTRFVTDCEGMHERIGLASDDKLRALGTEFLATNGPLFLDEFVP